MPKLHDLNFEDIATEHEVDFLFGPRRGFVPTVTYNRIQSGQYSFVVGRKGAGKTALRVASEKYFADVRQQIVLSTDFADFSAKLFFIMFDEVLAQLGIEAYLLIRNIWRYTFGLMLMQSLRRNHVISASARANRAVAKDLDIICDFLDLSGFGLETQREPSVGMCMTLLHHTGISAFKNKYLDAESVNLFPTNEPFKVAEKSACALLKTATGALIVLDDLDRVASESTYQRMIPFLQGLFEAILQGERDFLREGKVKITAFIPEDLFWRVKASYRHSDKIGHVLFVRNTRHLLKEMLAKRVANQMGLRSDPLQPLKADQIQAILSNVLDCSGNKLPVISDLLGRQRDVITFIIMHTLFRPRDLWLLMRFITSEAINCGNELIGLEEIRTGVKTGASILSDTIMQEYSLRMPEIRKLVFSFQYKNTHYTYISFMEAIHDACFQAFGAVDVSNTIRREALENLYEIGFFGKLKGMTSTATDPRPISIGEVWQAEFCFSRPQMQLTPNDEILIHPLFWGTLELLQNSPRVIEQFIDPPEYK